jgi:peptide/nickel transport system ATP-binding protein
MLFITHELPLLYNVTDNIMVMYAGEIVERGTAKQMVFDPIMPYSKGLMNSIIVPEEGTRGHVLQAIPGAPPNLKIRPIGCRFAARCKYADEKCRTDSVTEHTVTPDDGSERSYRCRHSLDELYQIYENELASLLDDSKEGSDDEK